MPESASALWRIVSLTAAKTRGIFEVSVAWVKLQVCDVSVTVRQKKFALASLTFSWPALADISSIHASSYASSRSSPTPNKKQNSLGIEIKMRPVHLIEPPQQILCCAIHIISSAVIWEIVSQRTPLQFPFEKIHFI